MEHLFISEGCTVIEKVRDDPTSERLFNTADQWQNLLATKAYLCLSTLAFRLVWRRYIVWRRHVRSYSALRSRGQSRSAGTPLLSRWHMFSLIGPSKIAQPRLLIATVCAGSCPEIGSNLCELIQRRLEILDDLGGDDFRRGQVV